MGADNAVHKPVQAQPSCSVFIFVTASFIHVGTGISIKNHAISKSPAKRLLAVAHDTVNFAFFNSTCAPVGSLEGGCRQV